MNGASAVIPCGTVDEAVGARSGAESGSMLLGGERGGVRIDGFDLSNSPAEYTAERVAGRLVAFTTTNGTKALLRAASADQILVGSFVNLSAVAHAVRYSDQPVVIVCAGTDGCVTGEDVLFAGALAESLLQDGRAEFEPTDSATIAISHWRSRCGNLSPETVEAALLTSQGGRNLTRLGFDADVRTAAQVDSIPAIGVVGTDGAIRQLNAT